MICRICRQTEGHWPREGSDKPYSTCPDCRAKKKDQGNFRREVTCKGCGALHTDKKLNGLPYKNCSECRSKFTEAAYKNKSGHVFKEGECHRCHKDTEPGFAHCNECREFLKTQAKYYQDKRRTNGLCTKCGGKRQNPAIMRCYRCVLKDHAMNTLGNRDRWEEIGRLLFNTQKCMCPYSGRRLNLGVDTSLDHKICVSAGGSHDISNLQWVHKQVNIMKHVLPERDFLCLVYEIADNLKKTKKVST